MADPRPKAPAASTGAKAKKKPPPLVTDEGLRDACADLDMSLPVGPQLAKALGVQPSSASKIVKKARALGLLGPLRKGRPPKVQTDATSNGATPELAVAAPTAAGTLTQSEETARKLYRQAVDKHHTDPVGFASDALGIPRDKAKRLIGLAS